MENVNRRKMQGQEKTPLSNQAQHQMAVSLFPLIKSTILSIYN